MDSRPPVRFDLPPTMPVFHQDDAERDMATTEPPMAQVSIPAVNPYLGPEPMTQPEKPRRWTFESSKVTAPTSRPEKSVQPARPTVRSPRDVIRDAVFRNQKVVSVFTLKGGVGKTSIAMLAADTHRILRPSFQVLVQDCNRDRGTLGDRIERTVDSSMVDVIANLDHIDSGPAFALYCTETAHGTNVLASTRPDDYAGIQRVSSEEFERLVQVERPYFQIVYNDLGTSADSPTTLGALAHSDVVVIPTTPAEDAVNQAMQTFAWMLSEDSFRDLARKRCILVVNRSFGRKKRDAIVNRFRDQFGDDFTDVKAVSLGISVKLSLGRRLDPVGLPAARQAELEVLCAEICRLSADAMKGDERSTLIRHAGSSHTSI